MSSDYSVTVKIRNGHMLHQMTLVGVKNARQLSILSGIGESTIGRLLNIKEIPLNKREEWREPVLKIANALRCLPEDLFPVQHLREPLAKNTATFDASLEDIGAYIGHLRDPDLLPDEKIERDQALEKLNKALQSLTPRQERLLRMRFGLDGSEPKTLASIGEVYGLTQSRARQIEARAMRTLKGKLRNDLHLLTTLAA